MINIPTNNPGHAGLVNKMLAFKVVRYVLLATAQRANQKGLSFGLSFAETHTFQKLGHPRHHYLPVSDMHCLNVTIDNTRIIRIGASRNFNYIFLNIDTDSDGNRMSPSTELFAWKLLYPFCSSNVKVFLTDLPINDHGSFHINGNYTEFDLNGEGYGAPSFISDDYFKERASEERAFAEITTDTPPYMSDIFTRIDGLAKKKFKDADA